METVLSQKHLEYQQEILNESGHQNWHKVLVHDFGGNNIEISVAPHETWSEPTDGKLGRSQVSQSLWQSHNAKLDGLYDRQSKAIEDGTIVTYFMTAQHQGLWINDLKGSLLAKTKRGEGNRSASSEAAARRAKRKVRHKCKLLKAAYMLTLTTKEVITDTERFQALFQEFVRRVRKVAAFEYVATHELQQRGALHLHIAIANRQDYKLLWSIWNRVVGIGQGRVHVSSGNRKASVNQIAAYISKYIAKSFETGELNKRRYWASKGIGEPVRTTHLLRPDWSFAEVLTYIIELCKEYGVDFVPDPRYCWQTNNAKGLFWIACSKQTVVYQPTDFEIDNSACVIA